MPIPPPRAAIEAFGLAGMPLLLVGGRGNAWCVGELVLRPVDQGESPLEWQADVLGSIARNEFRLSRPRKTRDGAFAREGWCAWEFVEGVHEEGRWRDIIVVGEFFHEALADVAEPDFIGRRSDPWAIGDRVAWEDLPAESFTRVKHLADLVAVRRPLDSRRQLVHGDLTGNVLFAEALAPAIIDFSPFWRPTAYASAIVVADALIWEGADESLLDAVAHIPNFPQFLVRALIMRAVVDQLFRERELTREDLTDPFITVVAIVCGLATE